MAAVLSNIVPDFFCLSPVDKGFFESPDYFHHVFIEGLLGAVVVNQIFQDVSRELVNACVDRMGLIDDLALEDIF